MEIGMAELLMEVSGSTAPIPRAGLINFTRGTIQLGGFQETKALKFVGTFYSISNEDMWLGNYPENMFDGYIYIAAVAKIRVIGGLQNHMSRLNQIWNRNIRACRDLTPASQNILTGFTSFSIFSQGCMETVRLDESYEQVQVKFILPN